MPSRKFREAQEENVVCEKCCEKLFVAIVFDEVFAKINSVEAFFHEIIEFSRRHWSFLVKNCEKKCSINIRRWVIFGHRQQPKPTFRNSTHSPRSPIAFCRQFSATLRSLNIKSRKLSRLEAAHFNTRSRAKRQQIKFYSRKKYFLKIICCQIRC